MFAKQSVFDAHVDGKKHQKVRKSTIYEWLMMYGIWCMMIMYDV